MLGPAEREERQCFEWATCAPSPPCFSPSKCTFRMLYRTKGAKHGAHKNEVSQRSLFLLGTSRKIVYTCRIPGTCETRPPGRTDSHCHSPPQTTASQFSMSSTAEPKGELGAERTRRRLLGEGGGWAQPPSPSKTETLPLKSEGIKKKDHCQSTKDGLDGLLMPSFGWRSQGLSSPYSLKLLSAPPPPTTWHIPHDHHC